MNKIKTIFTVIFIISIIIFYYVSSNINLDNLNINYLNILEYKYKIKKNNNFKIDILSIIINNYKYKKNYIINNRKESIVYNSNKPIIYIYNTHSNEEYSYLKNNLYNITPTITTASYMLKDELKKLGIESIVEKKNFTNILNQKGLPYSDSYKISREALENAILDYPTLTYFIDLHRDSVDRNITTTTINNTVYARTMFLLGLENENYEQNKKVMKELDEYLNINYKGLSRGIYEKKGKGVNGIYNQDFNSNTMLIEIGGVDNSIDEVANSIKVIANCLYNYIQNNKTT